MDNDIILICIWLDSNEFVLLLLFLNDSCCLTRGIKFRGTALNVMNNFRNLEYVCFTLRFWMTYLFDNGGMHVKI